MAGFAAATPLGRDLAATWARAAAGETGFTPLTRCRAETPCRVVGQIPDWDPAALPFADEKEVYNWHAAYVLLTMELCRAALAAAGLELTPAVAARTGAVVGSSINGADALAAAGRKLAAGGPLKISPYLLPNVCANVPAGKAGMLLGFTGPIFSPQAACASGNYALGLAARLIQAGELDFVLAGGVDMPLVPEIVHGFCNMNATCKLKPGDRAEADPGQASRPFSRDRRGFVLAEGGAILVLAAAKAARDLGLTPRAEILGVGWNSDAHHFTLPSQPTVVAAMRAALDDAGVAPGDIGCLNAHATSTQRGDAAEAASLREVFGPDLAHLPIAANKSQVGHGLAAAGAVEAVLAIEGMQHGVILPVANLAPDPQFADLNLAPAARAQAHELVLSNAFGFGGTNCCLVLRGV